MISSRWRAAIAALLTIALAAIAIAGCGDSSDSSGTTGGNSPSTEASTTESEETAAKPTGKPLKLFVTAFIDTPIGTHPEQFAAVKAAATAINEEGGIQGRPVQVVTCNGQFNAAQELACARKADEAGAVSVVGSMVVAAPSFNEVLAKEGLANIGETGFFEQSYQGKNAFPIDFFLGQFVACISPEMSKETGLDPVTVVASAGPAGELQVGLSEAAAKQSGTELSKVVRIPTTASDYASYVQEAVEAGESRLSMNLAPPMNAAFLQAAQAQGSEPTYCMQDDALQSEQREGLGPALQNYYVSASFPPLSEAGEFPMLQEFIDQMNAAEEAGDSAADIDGPNYTSVALRAWLGVQVFKQVANEMEGEIDAASFLQAISKAKVDLDGIVPDIDFAKPETGGPFTRVFNSTVKVNKWNVSEEQFDSTGLEVDTLKLLFG